MWREENRRTRRKTLGAGTRTNNKLNPHVTPGPGIEPGPQRWEASALPTAPSLLPSRYSPFKGILIFPWIKLITSHFSLQTSISSSFVLIGGQNTSSVVYCPHSHHRAFFRELVRQEKIMVSWSGLFERWITRWINHYPKDSVVCFVDTYPLDSDLSGG